MPLTYARENDLRCFVTNLSCKKVNTYVDIFGSFQPQLYIIVDDDGVLLLDDNDRSSFHDWRS